MTRTAKSKMRQKVRLYPLCKHTFSREIGRFVRRYKYTVTLIGGMELKAYYQIKDRAKKFRAMKHIMAQPSVWRQDIRINWEGLH